MKSNDRQFVGDFNKDNRADLYLFNGDQWAMPYLLMARSTGGNLAFTRRFDLDIPGWRMRRHDRFAVADSNGDGREELFVFNPDDWATEYLGMLKSNGSTLSGQWQADWINSWNLGASDKIFVANFSGGSRMVSLRPSGVCRERILNRAYSRTTCKTLQ